jgi:hypothetical protein
MNTFDIESSHVKLRTKRSGLLLSFFVLLILKVTFTQVILARGNASSLTVSTSESSNPIEKEIEAMDAINKKLAALSFGSPTVNGKTNTLILQSRAPSQSSMTYPDHHNTTI